MNKDKVADKTKGYVQSNESTTRKQNKEKKTPNFFIFPISGYD